MLFGLLISQAAALSTTIKGTTVNYETNGVTNYKRVVIAIPGQSEAPADMVRALVDATTATGCISDTLILCPDVVGTSYNLIEKKLVGSLKLADILDGFMAQFSNGKPTIFAGFSKGSQAIERYSLLTHPVQSGKTRYILGCASSFTFLDPNVDYRYGTRNFPVSIPDVESKVTAKNSYRIICGSKDTSDLDNSAEANAQGFGRVQRASNLNNLFVSKGVDSSIKFVPGVGHDNYGVMSKSGEFICSAGSSELLPNNTTNTSTTSASVVASTATTFLASSSSVMTATSITPTLTTTLVTTVSTTVASTTSTDISTATTSIQTATLGTDTSSVTSAPTPTDLLVYASASQDPTNLLYIGFIMAAQMIFL